MNALKILGWILVIFGILDFALYYLAGVDLTGVSWSPYLACGLGWGLIEIAKKKNEGDNSDDSEGDSGVNNKSESGSSTKQATSIISSAADIAEDLLG